MVLVGLIIPTCKTLDVEKQSYELNNHNDCSLDTIPLDGEVDEDNKELIRELSRLRYASDREAVEQDLYDSFDLDNKDTKEEQQEPKRKPPPKTEYQPTESEPVKDEPVRTPPVGIKHVDAEDIEFEEVV